MSIERVIVLKLVHERYSISKIVSFELSIEIPEVESWFYLFKNDNTIFTASLR